MLLGSSGCYTTTIGGGPSFTAGTYSYLTRDLDVAIPFVPGRRFLFAFFNFLLTQITFASPNRDTLHGDSYDILYLIGFDFRGAAQSPWRGNA
jgi:hypothetical protein